MSLQHLILGLLDAQPMSGYDLNRAFAQSAQHFWTTDQSSIYRALYKLADAGMVAVERIAQTDNPDKKVYHVTPAGGAELRHWLATPIADSPVREAWLGQIFFADAINREQLLRVLGHYRDTLAERLGALEDLDRFLNDQWPPPDEQPYGLRLRRLTLDYGLAVHRFESAWLESAMDRIAGWPSADQQP